MGKEPTSCYFCGSYEMYQGAFIQNIEKFDVFVCVECLKKELRLKEYGEPIQMNFNDKTLPYLQKCLCIHALDRYETFKIDDNTIGVRPIWIEARKQPPRKDIPILVLTEFSEMPNVVLWVEDGTYGEPGFF